MPEARDHVVVDHAGRLHEGIERRRSDEAEAFRLQRFADPFRYIRLSRHTLQRCQPVDDRAAFDKSPYVSRKRDPLSQRQIGFCVRNRRFDLRTVSNDALVVHQTRDVALGKVRNARRIEVMERFAKILALPQDRQP